jgi:hypothetical protein
MEYQQGNMAFNLIININLNVILLLNKECIKYEIRLKYYINYVYFEYVLYYILIIETLITNIRLPFSMVVFR